MNTAMTISDDQIKGSVKKKNNFSPWMRPLFYSLAITAHLILIITMSFDVAEKETLKDNTIFKVVDITEYVPPEEPEKEKEEEPPPPPPKEETIEVDPQEGIVEDVQVTEKTVVEREKPIEFMPQHKISDPPVIPVDEIRSKIIYPALANRQKIEGVVYLELFIDSQGMIRKIDILKDPGYGLAEAAIAAFDNIRCVPAKANGQPVAVRFRYPIRFQLK